MERVYNKLVRDNIPSIIESNGETPITRILSDEEYTEEKSLKRGAFEEKIFLEKVLEKTIKM